MQHYISILLQSQPGGGGMMQLVFLLAIIVVFYFFMIRPQVRKQKLEKEFRNKLEKGAKVVTIGGVYGKITEVHDFTFKIEIAPNVQITIQKSAISADATKGIEQHVPAKTT